MSEFDNINGFGEATAEGAGAAPATTKAAGDTVMKKMYDEVVNKINSDPEYVQRRNSRSKDLIVTKIFGFGKTGSLEDMTNEFIDKAIQAGTVTVLPADSTEIGAVEEKDGVLTGTVKAATKGKDPYVRPYIAGKPMTNEKGKANLYRKVVARPENVGYEIKNVSDKAIDYKTAVYAQDETGKYVATEIMQSLAPGKTAVIARVYLTLLALAEEYNLALGNGTVIVKVGKGEGESIEKGYFQFKKDSGMDVNSPEVKQMISEEITVNNQVKYVVKPEFVETFGYLNNEKEKAVKKTKTAKPEGLKPTTAEVTAAYLRQKLGL